MSSLSPQPAELPATLPRVDVDAELNLARATLQQAFSYWKRVKGDRRMPRRADLVPREMKAFISHIALVEPRKLPGGTRDYFVRLAGTRIDEIFGPRGGHMLTDGLSPELAARWRAPFDHVMTTGEPLRLSGRLSYRNMNWIEFEGFYAPLGEESAPPSMFFYGFAIMGGQRPRRSDTPDEAA